MHRQHDWLPVLGQEVQIKLDGSVVRTGLVDGVTNDGAIIWIAAHGATPRAMFERARGFSVWIDYKWDSSG
ncbi:hypothetical protein ARTHRO9AX_10315 [Arthrobacter sp. 9AX]|uniref:hypothetical protein n=1 Tax=Arthrobacter sp. 9AX TaxID=2653131 RepID=UPI0012F0D03D|nr:hypothetical protein [Arthrobacter sp. 9AX]VXB05061.1 hypothetical protein ARTHRO9AX_10315 [Arthrobacter sp. 9AX]